MAGAAEAALAALGDPLPDLILVDYNLPGMRGDEFCRRIRMNLNTRSIPLLIMTGSAPETAEIQSLDSGADAYIAKSENTEILLLRIRALLRKGAAEDVILNSPEIGIPQRFHPDYRRQPHVSRGSLPGDAQPRLSGEERAQRSGRIEGTTDAKFRLRPGRPGDAVSERHRGVPADYGYALQSG